MKRPKAKDHGYNTDLYVDHVVKYMDYLEERNLELELRILDLIKV